jgi:hypothetical protein
MRDWLGMKPEDFDTDVEPTLFDVEPVAATPDDGCGTGDLLAELPGD